MGSPRPRIPFGRVVAGLAAAAVILAGVRLLTTSRASEEPIARPSAGTSPREGRPLPPCEAGDRRARPDSYDDWDRTLIDPTFGLNPSYVPPDLVSVGRAGFRESFLVRELMIPDLTALREAAEETGHALGIAAGFRSYGTQASLYRRRVESLDRDEATGKTARPGHSEHQLGTTLDFKSAGESDVTKSWGNTPEGTWMADNAWRFGFQLVYPRNRTAETCFWFEPWHFRYFGGERAAEIHTSGLTVREFLWEER